VELNPAKYDKMPEYSRASTDMPILTEMPEFIEAIGGKIEPVMKTEKWDKTRENIMKRRRKIEDDGESLNDRKYKLLMLGDSYQKVLRSRKANEDKSGAGKARARKKLENTVSSKKKKYVSDDGSRSEDPGCCSSYTPLNYPFVLRFM